MMLVECTRACPPSPKAFACSSYYYAVTWIEPTYSSEAGLGRWSHRLRGACEQAARLAVCSRPDARLAEAKTGFPAVSAQVRLRTRNSTTRELTLLIKHKAL